MFPPRTPRYPSCSGRGWRTLPIPYTDGGEGSGTCTGCADCTGEASMKRVAFLNAAVVYPNEVLAGGAVFVIEGRIAPGAGMKDARDVERIDVGGMYLAPGFVDLHVYGGGGADFMDLTPAAFRTACRTHARHGTTSL